MDISPREFSTALFERIQSIEPAAQGLVLNEFCYALDDLHPEEGWDSIHPEPPEEVARTIRQRSFFEAVQVKRRENDRIVLDKSILHLTRMLFAGLVSGAYSVAWVKKLFYFDVRGFFFLPRTLYLTDKVVHHFGGKAFKSFEPRQNAFESVQDLGFRDFQEANAEIDGFFIEVVKKIISIQGTPILITLAGPSAAGKTEITERLIGSFEQLHKTTTTIEMDNFLFDRDLREDKPMGRETTHFNLFKQSLQDILQGKHITIPRYNFNTTTSSHDPQGRLKPGCSPLVIEPADIIFLEGNFPFHMDEIASLIGIKIVYLTDDPVRLKRKWKRDIDYRKKFDPTYFRNRYFKTQFLRADDIYLPLLEKADMLVDTTGAALWLATAFAARLDGS